MRYGVLADIHGNLHALQAAIAVLDRCSVDAYICAGDVIGYGPHPNECLARIAELGAVCVAGNHELITLGRLSDRRPSQLARGTLEWTRGVLTEASRAYVADLPLTVSLGRVAVTHATLENPQRRVNSEERAREQLIRLADQHPEAQVLIVGHTHYQFVFSDTSGGATIPVGPRVALEGHHRYLLNPGSVGQSRQREGRPKARCLLLDLELGEAQFFALDYDVRASRRALRRAGLPLASMHEPPGLVPRALRRGRRLVRESVNDRLTLGRRQGWRSKSKPGSS